MEIRKRVMVPLASGNTAVTTLCAGRLDGLLEARGGIVETGVAFYAVLPRRSEYGDAASIAAIAEHCNALEARGAEAQAETDRWRLEGITLTAKDPAGKIINGATVEAVVDGRLIERGIVEGVTPIGD